MTATPALNWRDSAACATDDTAPGFLEAAPDRRAYVLARSVCAGCPVLDSCRAYAYSTRPTWGLWAGQWWTERGPQ